MFKRYRGDPKFQIGHLTQAMPFWGKFLISRQGTGRQQLAYKI